MPHTKIAQHQSLKPLVLLLIVSTLLFAGCSEPDEVGTNLITSEDVYLLDSLEIDLETIVEDTVLTSNPVSYIFGEYFDPEFGTTTAHSNVQLLPEGGEMPGKDSGFPLRFDSLKLQVLVLAFIGETTEAMTWEAYELDEVLSREEFYYSNRVAAIKPENLLPTNRVVFQGETEDDFNTITDFTLPIALGERLLNIDDATLDDPEAFKQVFPGIQLRATRESPTGNGIVYYPVMTDEDTHIRLHYTELTDSGEVQHSYDFELEPESAGYNYYERSDSEGTLFANTQDLPKEQREFLFAQGATLVRIGGQVPQSVLDTLSDKVVTLAFLEIPVIEEYNIEDDNYLQPSSLLFYEAEGDENYTRVGSALERSTGSYSEEANVYRFTFSGYLQALNSGELPNNGFTLIPRDAPASFRRTILASPNHPTLKPRLKVYYTPLQGL